MGEQRKIRVAIVFGGRSAEHAVSCASAGLVLGAIDRDRYEVSTHRPSRAMPMATTS